MRERLMQLLGEAIEPYLDRLYPWDTFSDIADYLLDNGVIVPPVKVGQTVWYIGGAITLQVHPAKITDIHYNGKTFVYRFVYRVEAHGYLCFESAFGSDDDNEEIYTTREAAEAALKARENK